MSGIKKTRVETSNVEYGFSLLEDDDTKRVGLIKKILNPDYFNRSVPYI
jgi:hypothetical protein